jgi:AraC-like DNA-binding protein
MMPLSLTASTARVSVKLLAPFVRAAAQLGLPVEAGLVGVGLSLADLDNSELRLSHAVLAQLLAAALSRGGARDLGLLAAECLQPEHLDLIEYAARSQPTLRAGLEHALRYYALLHDGFSASLHVAGERATLEVSFGALQVADCIHEFVLAAHVIVARRMTGRGELAPLETHFMHARPTSARLHEHFFGTQLRFGQTRCALVFARSALDAPSLAADAGLAQVLERQAEQALRKLGRGASLLDRVREIVREELSHGKLTADSLARRLGMSARTLHRHLASERTSYRAVLDEVRREIALRSLRDPRLTILEVSYSLGFTTGPAFHRAFRRWTGTSAAALRSELLK